MKEETVIQRTIQNFVKSRQGVILKLHGNEFQQSGAPDLIGGLPIVCAHILSDGFTIRNVNTVPFVVECKTEHGAPSRIQLHRLAVWRNVGYAAGVVHSLNTFIDLIANYVRKGGIPTQIDPTWLLDNGGWEVTVSQQHD